MAEKLIECENIIFMVLVLLHQCASMLRVDFQLLGCNSFALVDHTYPIFAKLKNTSDNMVFALSITGGTTEIIELFNGFKTTRTLQRS